MHLNDRALKRCESLIAESTSHRVALLRDETGARIIDCGVHVPGGLRAGLVLAEICLADLGQVTLAPPSGVSQWPLPRIMVSTDHPVAACLASQYAGWQVAGEKFFAMGSGPMRAARGREPILDTIPYRERAASAVGVLESGKLPHVEVCQQLAKECSVETEQLTLLVAPTSSLAGTVQVVARSVETALHKMHEIGFDLSCLVSGFGTAPLPPVARDELQGIARTNDAILYGGEVTLWVRTSDEILTELGPRVPSSSSSDHGRPFLEIFEQYHRDFYQIDPLLFSPAVVTLNNLETGNSFRFGETRFELLRRSCGLEAGH
jgi:methenyltetrahydromethanopterin cyclohydrolase